MPRSTDSNPRRRSIWVLLARYSGLALMLPAAVLVGYWIGIALDQALHSGRVFTVIGVLLGVAAGLLEFMRETLRIK